MEDFIDDLDRIYSRARDFSAHGYNFVLTVNDPYGFWTVQVLKVKKQPEAFDQQFTTIEEAKRTASLWAESQEILPTVESVEEAPVPALRTKKRVNK